MEYHCNSLFKVLLLLFIILPFSATADNLPLGKRIIYFKCSGEGSPTVILESGFRNNSDVWAVSRKGNQTIFLMIAQFTRVCVYDRPGTVGWHASSRSRSSPVVMPRSAQEVVADLHALLQQARIKGPYVLVGHSLGGLFVRLYASTYPKDVVGLVLVDAFSEYVQTSLSPEQWNAYRSYIVNVPPKLSNYKDLETIDFDAASKITSQMVEKNPFNKPVVVISRGQSPVLPTDFPVPSKVLEEGWQQSQSDLARLYPKVPLIIAKNSQHFIQIKEPDLIVNAVKSIVQKLRREYKGSLVGEFVMINKTREATCSIATLSHFLAICIINAIEKITGSIPGSFNNQTLIKPYAGCRGQ